MTKSGTSTTTLGSLKGCPEGIYLNSSGYCDITLPLHQYIGIELTASDVDNVSYSNDDAQKLDLYAENTSVIVYSNTFDKIYMNMGSDNYRRTLRFQRASGAKTSWSVISSIKLYYFR